MKNFRHLITMKHTLFITSLLSTSPIVLAESIITLVKNINPGSYSSSPHAITDINGTAIFLANSGGLYGDHLYALWKSDGTEAGTQFIIDLDNPEYSGTYGEFTAFKGDLFFRALSSNGYELWTSDGTAFGTFEVKDIYPGSSSGSANSSYPEFLTAFDTNNDQQDDLLLFLAKNEQYGKELWRSDGTAQGTYLLKDIHADSRSIDRDNVSSHYFYHTIVNNIMYFTAINVPYTDNAGNYIGGYELWRTDGTKNGTYLVKDLTPFNNIPYGPGSSSPRHLTELNDMLIFSAAAKNIGTELFRSDGTAAGTVLIKDINPQGSSYPSNMVKVADKIFFMADDGIHGNELWVTDGTYEGTHLVKELVAGAGGVTDTFIQNVSNRDRPILDNMTAFKDQLFFRFNDGEYNHGFELWRSDGTAAGTDLFMDIGTGLDQFGYAASAYPDELTVLADKLFFSAWDPLYFRELWETDGTYEGTQIVANLNQDTNPTYGSSNPTQLTRVGDELFFSAFTYAYGTQTERTGYELWKVIYNPFRVFTSAEEDVTGAYIAYYGRPADPRGMYYWADRLAKEGSLSSIIEAFGESQEFEDRFGSLSNRDLVTNLYIQLLGRNPDIPGLNYYVAELNAGRMTLQSISLNILYGAQNEDVIMVDNRKKVAKYYISQLEVLNALDLEPSAEALASLIADIKVDTNTVISAYAVIDSLTKDL